ncbi:MAG: arginase [Rhizobiaceae bacterium]|nr:arginase [Rhizobiaceae bacterium]
MPAIALLGVPVDCGQNRPGCLMGPDALRCAGLVEALVEQGCDIVDLGNIVPKLSSNSPRRKDHHNQSLKHLNECSDWITAIHNAAYQAGLDGYMPIFLGGDHLMAAGTVSGLARYSAKERHDQFVLWLDAHTDFHTLDSTTTGNLHGTPLAYFTGQEGFGKFFPELHVPVKPENICMLGIRSVDNAEQARLSKKCLDINDMRTIDETGIAEPLRAFLERVKSCNGRLHVSFDVDFLDPSIAPAVGTCVPGGATFREAHLVMEMLHDSGLVTSLDVAELNPFLDERGRTATLMVDLVASLFGKRVMDRPTRSF